MSALWISWNNRLCWIWEMEEVFQLWMESYRFQWVKDMVMLAEMLCLCTSCRWLFFCWLPESVGYLVSPSLHAKWQHGLVTCQKSSLGITSYFLTLYHRLNHTTNTEVLWIRFILVKCSAEQKYPGALLLVSVRSRFLLSSTISVFTI